MKSTSLTLGACLITAFLNLLFGIEAQASDEVKTMKEWTEKSFIQPEGMPTTVAASPTPGLRVIRQDHGSLEINRSVIETPLHIGTKDFAHGLGVNSISEIEVTLPPGARRFDAQVGVDNNHDTAGIRGSVEFIVQANGKNLFNSNLLRSGAEPVPVSVDITGASTLVLHVTDGGDGASWDQGDWAEASLTLSNGRKIELDELPVVKKTPLPRSITEIPFTFSYDGKSSDDLLKAWPRTMTDVPSVSPGKRIRKIAWKDPVSGLEVLCELTQFDDAPATDWMVKLTNEGRQESPVIENLQAMDMTVPLQNPMVRASNGSTGGLVDFVPTDRKISGQGIIFSGANGRSSQATLPFFNLFDEQNGGGFMLGLGWSGQWEARFCKTVDDQGNQELRLLASQQGLRVKLQPGESIRTPRILLLHYNGPDNMRGHNLLRQTLLSHYVPQIDGKPATPPVAAITWFSFNQGSGVTEANQLGAVAAMAPYGVEDFWLDAGWYGTGNWTSSVGSWDVRKASFPRGLKPLSDASHAAGMKMIVWFEPERVQKNTTISIEYPEFVHGGSDGGLFKLDDPIARQWMTKLLDEHIHKDGIDVLRIDYNLDPLKYWREADAPDRRGMTENLYMQGLYMMWDELRARNPGMLIDDCASGGRRIDLETISRSIPLWRSDLPCQGIAHPTSDQAETAGLSLWVPISTEGLWAFDAYTARSVATAGTVICCNLGNKKFLPQDINHTIGEIKELRKLWLGDYYPLTPIGVDDAAWMAWQFNRADLGRGFAMIFRRPKVAETSFTAMLRGLDPTANYEVRLVDTGKILTMTGKGLESFKVDVPTAPSSVLMVYRKL